MRSGSVLFLKEVKETYSLGLVSGSALEFFFLVLAWLVIPEIRKESTLHVWASIILVEG